MIRIGIVGDIGAGKSYIAKLFNYPVFNADEEVSKLYKKNKKCYEKLKKILPKHITSFPIKKNELLKAILERQNNIKKINKVIHPKIRFILKKFIKKNKKKKFVVLDIPLLLENKINKKNDILIFVDAKKSEINKRLMKRKGFNKKIIKSLKKFQLTLELKKKKSNFVIKNNFINESAKKSVKKILNKIL